MLAQPFSLTALGVSTHEAGEVWYKIGLRQTSTFVQGQHQCKRLAFGGRCKTDLVFKGRKVVAPYDEEAVHLAGFLMLQGRHDAEAQQQNLHLLKHRQVASTEAYAEEAASRALDG